MNYGYCSRMNIVIIKMRLAVLVTECQQRLLSLTVTRTIIELHRNFIKGTGNYGPRSRSDGTVAEKSKYM